ncbi:hypothetical protein Bca52824_027954 [Brassica carinata]|uniref:Uncharacterized protein n=1 Tax=Brassica carinata TaxID=52824 RepID=A0A8X7VBE9_BRACI|nr:hypothetical protein Bca52824_027954 [Brassica carinata]
MDYGTSTADKLTKISIDDDIKHLSTAPHRSISLNTIIIMADERRTKRRFDTNSPAPVRDRDPSRISSRTTTTFFHHACLHALREISGGRESMLSLPYGLEYRDVAVRAGGVCVPAHRQKQDCPAMRPPSRGGPATDH